MPRRVLDVDGVLITQEEEMLTTPSAVTGIDAGDVGFSVYAHVDEETLEMLNRSADEQDLPRSWLITRILQDWAAEQVAHAELSVAKPPKQNIAA